MNRVALVTFIYLFLCCTNLSLAQKGFSYTTSLATLDHNTLSMDYKPLNDPGIAGWDLVTSIALPNSVENKVEFLNYFRKETGAKSSFEYYTTYSRLDSARSMSYESLNKPGKDGWELVCVVELPSTPESTREKYVEFFNFFKRPIK